MFKRVVCVWKKTNRTFITKKYVNVVLGDEDAFDVENNTKFLNAVRSIRKSAFAKTLQATISVVMSVCPSTCPHENLCSYWKDFLEIWYLSIFRKYIQ